MSKTNKASDFIANMNIPTAAAPAQAKVAVVAASSKKITKAPAEAATRKSLKHIGGYFAPEIVEKVAVLRARLNLDNSELLELAIDELYSKQKTKRAFDSV